MDANQNISLDARDAKIATDQNLVLCYQQFFFFYIA